MNDDRLTTALGSFYKGTAQTPSDPELGLERVMARVPRTRQRGRWWPRPSLGQAAAMPSAIPDPEQQSTPVPATSGYPTTITGRTRVMFSPVKAIVAGAVVFALGGAFLVAQPFEQQGGSVPGAEDPVTATHVVGTVTANTTGSGGEWSALDGLITNRDAAYEHVVEWNDPRLPATMRFSENLNRYNLGGDAGAMAFVGNIRFESPEGAWTGSEYGLAEESETGLVLQPRMMVLTGDGAYEGLTAMLQRRYESDDVTFTHPVFEGYIFDGELPPMPDPVEPSAE